MTTAKLDPFTTAGGMLRALAGRQVSAVELLELHVVRIARHDGTLNAIVTRDFERARRQAEAADTARARGEEGPLLGLPMTLKESINVTGLRTTVGVPEWSRFVSDHDAPATTRVRKAGAVVVGKTNVPPVLADWQADNPIFGRTVNPWDPARTPGGSTGGGAAALAAGLTPLEVGSDIGGSIRVPAAFCGVYGHKPSETALPRSGQFPYPPMPNAAVAMGVQGPLARSAEDLELALDVLAGPDTGGRYRLAARAAGGAPHAARRVPDRRPAADRLAPGGRRDYNVPRSAGGRARERGRHGQAGPARDPRRSSPPPRALPHAPRRGDVGAPARRGTAATHRDLENPRRRVRPGEPPRSPGGRRGVHRLLRPARAVPGRLPCLLPRVGRAPRADHARARVSPRSEALPTRRQVAARHPRGRRPQRPLRSAARLPRCRA